MGPVDAMFWRLEQERLLRSTTMAVALLDSLTEVIFGAEFAELLI
jgi:hypothetical protein